MLVFQAQYGLLWFKLTKAADDVWRADISFQAALTAAATGEAVGLHAHMPPFTRAVGRSPVQFPTGHDAASHARTKQQRGHIADRAPQTKPAFAQRHCVRAVVKID